MNNDGYFDWSFKHHNGGVDKVNFVFKPIIIKLSYSIRFVFVKGILGIRAVELVRDNPMITKEYSRHQYICAN